MGEAIIARRGGASSGPLKKAAIVVSYPSGATCTVSNGTKTYTALDTSGTAAFAVEPGTWTVKAVQGSNTASKSVTVAAGKGVSVELSFFTGLVYNNGTDYVGLSYVNVEGSDIYMSKESNHILLEHLASGGKSAGFMSAAVDISSYTKLSVTYTPGNTGTHPFYAAVHSTKSPNYDSGPAASTLMSQDHSTDQTVSLDISSLTGVYYVGIYGKGWGGAAVTSKILKIQLSE